MNATTERLRYEGLAKSGVNVAKIHILDLHWGLKNGAEPYKVAHSAKHAARAMHDAQHWYAKASMVGFEHA